MVLDMKTSIDPTSGEMRSNRRMYEEALLKIEELQETIKGISEDRDAAKARASQNAEVAMIFARKVDRLRETNRGMQKGVKRLHRAIARRKAEINEMRGKLSEIAEAANRYVNEGQPSIGNEFLSILACTD